MLHIHIYLNVVNVCPQVLMIIFLPKLCYRRAAATRNVNAKGARATGANQSGTAVSNESCLDPAQRLHQASTVVILEMVSPPVDILNLSDEVTLASLCR